MYKIKFKHFLFPILPKFVPLMWLFSFCAGCNLAVPFPVDCSVQFRPFSNNKRNNFHFLSAYCCILLIHLDSVHLGNRLIINAWWQWFLWKICRLSKSEIDFGVLFFRTCRMLSLKGGRETDWRHSWQLFPVWTWNSFVDQTGEPVLPWMDWWMCHALLLLQFYFGPGGCFTNQVKVDVRSRDVAKSSNVPKFSNGRT